LIWKTKSTISNLFGLIMGVILLSATTAIYVTAKGEVDNAIPFIHQDTDKLNNLKDVSKSVLNYDLKKHCATDLAKMPNTPTEFLTYFNCGHVSQFKNGTVLREFSLIVREDKNVSLTMGNPATKTKAITYNAWTFNGTVPGPTMRMTEGDLVKIKVINQGKIPHSLHMHSIHPGAVDGTMFSNASGAIKPGESFTYQFTAAPSGLWPYHCHMMPLSLHVTKGLYGAMIIDPVKPKEKAVEMIGIMNGFDLGLNNATELPRLPTYEEAQQIMSGNDTAENALPQERDNHIYALNTVAFYYDVHPIQLKVNTPYRFYLVNMLDFDFANQFHIHGNVFKYYPSGIGENPMMVNDIVTLGQGDRGILEFKYTLPGLYMIHSHFESQSGRGWEGLLSVK
jgi:FtsP/CotA-like multicopper oxidase with cupredoxin domain